MKQQMQTRMPAAAPLGSVAVSYRLNITASSTAVATWQQTGGGSSGGWAPAGDAQSMPPAGAPAEAATEQEPRPPHAPLQAGSGQPRRAPAGPPPHPPPTMLQVMTALPLKSRGRRPARSTSQMATKVKAKSVPPTMAALMRAAWGGGQGVGGGERGWGPAAGTRCTARRAPRRPLHQLSLAGRSAGAATHVHRSAHLVARAEARQHDGHIEQDAVHARPLLRHGRHRRQHQRGPAAQAGRPSSAHVHAHSCRAQRQAGGSWTGRNPGAALGLRACTAAAAGCARTVGRSSVATAPPPLECGRILRRLAGGSDAECKPFGTAWHAGRRHSAAASAAAASMPQPPEYILPRPE